MDFFIGSPFVVSRRREHDDLDASSLKLRRAKAMPDELQWRLPVGLRLFLENLPGEVSIGIASQASRTNFCRVCQTLVQ
jgi:hypothetical protein